MPVRVRRFCRAFGAVDVELFDLGKPVLQFLEIDIVLFEFGIGEMLRRDLLGDLALVWPQRMPGAQGRLVLWRSLGQKSLKVDRIIDHGKVSFSVTWPFGLGAVAVKLYPIAIGIRDIDRLADSVISGALNRDPGLDQAAQGIGQLRAIRVEERSVIKPCVTLRCGCATKTFPGIQTKVVMIATSRQKCRPCAEFLLNLKTKHALVKGDGAVKVGHFQVDMANAGLGVNGGHDQGPFSGYP